MPPVAATPATSFMNAVDTNVFVYALDADEPEKQQQAIDLIDRLCEESSETILLWQVAGEFLSCLRRWESAGVVSSTETESHLEQLLQTFPLAIPTTATLQRSIDLNRRFSLSHWDSMLIAACQEAKV